MARSSAATTVIAVADANESARAAVGADYRERRTRLGISPTELAKRAGVDRSRIRKVEDGDTSVRDATIGAIGRALSDLETELSMDVPSAVAVPEPAPPNLIRIKVEGVYGAKALIVEGAPQDQAQLEAMVDRIMRNLRDGPGSPEGVE